jgi:hypothetical protein
MNTKTTYTKPSFKFWSASELNAIQAKMSGGGGYTPPTSYKVHILFSPIVLSGIKIPFDHAALFVSYSGTDYGYFYSYAADPSAGVGLISGTDGYLATARSSNSGHVQQQVYYSSILSTGKVYVDKISDGSISHGYDDGYYCAINFTTTSDIATGLKNYGNTQLGTNGTYKLLWSNCYDKAQAILATRNILVEYDWSGTALFIAGAITAIGIASPLLAAALSVSVGIGTIAAGHLNIPNKVYENFIRVQRNGTTLPSSGKNMFRAR